MFFNFKDKSYANSKIETGLGTDTDSKTSL